MKEEQGITVFLDGEQINKKIIDVSFTNKNSNFDEVFVRCPRIDYFKVCLTTEDYRYMNLKVSDWTMEDRTVYLTSVK